MRKVSLGFIENELNKENYELLSTEYINNTSKMMYRCNNGHIREFTWSNWKKGARCRICANEALSVDRRLSFEDVGASFIEEGYVILECAYKNASSTIRCMCTEGHVFETCWRDWYSGNRCPVCSKDNLRMDYHYIKHSFEEEGCTLLSEKYVNNKSKLRYKCPRGNVHEISWNSWQQGKRCPCCNSKSKRTIEFISSKFDDEGYSLLSNVYTDNKHKLKYKCPNGHIHSITWGNWLTGYRCPKCNNLGTSKQEKELIDFVKSITSNVIEHDRSIIPPLELDIVIPDERIAIEYCGLYWHSELTGKDRNYHLNKLELCENAGYTLITIFEDELLFKKDIIKSILKYKFNGGCFRRIYARNCVVKEIETKQAREFCEKNHLQGYAGSSIKLGLFYNDELVSVMTFSKQSIAKGRKHENGFWELSRFCNKINYIVIGAASKLLKYFEYNFECYRIISYADRRWSDGGLYDRLGFVCEKATNPNYWYFKGPDLHRIYRFSLRKKDTDFRDLTEWELRKEQGYNRIWDCGNLRYVKYLSCKLKDKGDKNGK